MNDTSHLRLCDNAFLKNRMPQSTSAPVFPRRFTHFWKVAKEVGAAQDCLATDDSTLGNLPPPLPFLEREGEVIPCGNS